MNYRDVIQVDTTNAFNVQGSFKDKSFEDIRIEQDRRSKPFSVMTLSVTGDLNVGCMIRTSVTFGARAFYLVGRRVFDKRSCVGSQNYIDLHRIGCLQDDGLTIDPDVFRQILIDHNLFPIYVEQDENSRRLTGIGWPWTLAEIEATGKQPCFIFGSEGTGIPKELIRDNPGITVEIPMIGVMRSLNVANSSSIVLYDLCAKMGWI